MVSGDRDFSNLVSSPPPVSVHLPKDSPIQLPAWHCSAQQWLCQPGWTMSLPPCHLHIPLHPVTVHFIFGAFFFYPILCYAAVLRRPAAGIFPFSSLFFCIVKFCVCLCVMSAVHWEPVSGWLKRWFIGARCWRNSPIAPQITSSQMSSLHSTTVNRSRKLAPKTRADVHMHTCIRTHTHSILYLHISPLHSRCWEECLGFCLQINAHVSPESLKEKKSKLRIKPQTWSHGIFWGL